jgi:hypothetical protein
MKILEKMFRVGIGEYSGFLIRETLAKKLAKLLFKHEQEIKSLIANNLEDVEISNWTLAHPYKQQTVIEYFDDESTKEYKLRRLELFNRQKYLIHIPVVFKIAGTLSESSKLAEEEGMRYYENLPQE